MTKIIIMEQSMVIINRNCVWIWKIYMKERKKYRWEIIKKEKLKKQSEKINENLKNHSKIKKIKKINK